MNKELIELIDDDYLWGLNEFWHYYMDEYGYLPLKVLFTTVDFYCWVRRN
jgi:hypothetical protein